MNRAFAYKVLGDGKVEVYDLDFASYCVMRGMIIADMVETGFKRKGQPPNYLFEFNDPDDSIGKMSVDFANSESARFADCVRRLKKGIRSTCHREG
jgi:hypothetical protein